MSGIQIVGSTNNTTAAEVEVNTKALRTVIRPNDYGSLGIFSVSGTSGTMAASLAANSEIFQFRWTSTTNFALIKHVLISAGSVAAMTTAQAAAFNIIKSSAWTADGTGGTAITPAASQNRLRTSMASSGVGTVRIASTAALGAGTKTLETNGISAVSFGITTTAGVTYLAPTNLWQAQAGDHPFILSPQATNFEGFSIIAPVAFGAGGTWNFSVKVTWEELAAY